VRIYTIMCTVPDNDAPGAFAGIDFDFGDDVPEFAEYQYDITGDVVCEVYTLRTKRDIDRSLDLSDGVVSYHIEERDS